MLFILLVLLIMFTAFGIIYPVGFFIIHRLLGGKKSFMELYKKYM